MPPCLAKREEKANLWDAHVWIFVVGIFGDLFIHKGQYSW